MPIGYFRAIFATRNICTTYTGTTYCYDKSAHVFIHVHEIHISPCLDPYKSSRVIVSSRPIKYQIPVYDTIAHGTVVVT